VISSAAEQLPPRNDFYSAQGSASFYLFLVPIDIFRWKKKLKECWKLLKICVICLDGGSCPFISYPSATLQHRKVKVKIPFIVDWFRNVFFSLAFGRR